MHELITSGWTMHYLTRSAVTLALMGAVAWLGDRWLRRIGPAAQHRLWLAALLMSVLLPLVPAAWLTGLPAEVGAEAEEQRRLRIAWWPHRGVGASRLSFPRQLSAVYLLSVLFALTRLMWRWRRTCAMLRRSAAAALDDRAAAVAGRCRATGWSGRAGGALLDRGLRTGRPGHAAASAGGAGWVLRCAGSRTCSQR